ncbi:MAG: DUF2807 domain-containing protein [Kordiimonadaceae bacterium]|nr:DUF2807 domain-containing protein [Kordiimonadaceae bacterium]
MKTLAIIGAGIGLTIGATVWAGSTAEQTRDVSKFNAVTLHGSIDVDVLVGEEQSVRVVADDTVIDKLITEVSMGTLKIKLKNGYHSRIKKMHVYVTVPKLSGGAIHGSGDMDIKGPITGDFSFSVHGSGNGKIETVDASGLDLAIHGSGDLSIEGSCAEADVSIHGSGDISARGMKCVDVDIDVHGSGDVSIAATHGVEAAVFGSGDIDIYGKPDKVQSKVRGSGDINIH